MDGVYRWLSGGIMVALLLGCGIVFTVRHRFFPFRRAGLVLRSTVGRLFEKDEPTKGISPFQAVSTALAGTMGVGNIAGVATALVAGGPGAIFWMWISALLGMMTKYAEIYLAVRYRKQKRDGSYYGGPMYYIRDGTGSGGLAAFYATLCALTSFGIGNLAQSNAVSQAMESAFSAPRRLSGVLVALLVALVIFGGIRRIARVTELVIPFISIIYLCFSGAFLFINRSCLSGAFVLIFSEAFALRSALGGAAGYGIATALRMGLARGVFTNEAGLGSASIAHAAADCKSPEQQACWGIFEVFLDTIVVCSVTGLVILCADGGRLWQSGADGSALTALAFESLFVGIGGKFIAVSILFYAVAAMLGWCYYGECAVRYLSGGSGTLAVYRILFVLAAFVGAVGNLEAIWRTSDVLNALMAVPNVIALLMLRRKVKTP